MHAKAHGSQEAPSIRVPLRRRWRKLPSLPLELCTVSKYGVWFQHSTTQPSATLNMWTSPRRETSIESLFDARPLFPCNYSLARSRLYMLYKHNYRTVNSKTGVGLEIWHTYCMCTHIYRMALIFFPFTLKTFLTYGWLWNCTAMRFPLTQAYPYDFFALSRFLSGALFLPTVTVMQTRIVWGWWDADKLYARSSVSLPVRPCLEQLDTLNSGAYQKLHVSGIINLDTIVTGALSYIQWTHEPQGPLWLICLPPRGKNVFSPFMWSFDL